MTMTMYRSDVALVPQDEGTPLHEPTDGRRVWLPHPLLQSTIFAATRPDLTPQKIERVNRFGDVIRIDSPRVLTTGTDLPIFLSTLALAQKYGIREGNISGNRVCFAAFPISELYGLLGVDRRNRKCLTQALYDIGRTSFLIQYRDPEKHGCRHKWESGFFWIPALEIGKGRRGSQLQLQINKYLVPRPEVYLFAQVELVTGLKSDVAKGIFWTLLCRESLRTSGSGWQEILGATDSNLRRWRHKVFYPALEELETLGYTWRGCEDGDIVVHRPRKKIAFGTET